MSKQQETQNGLAQQGQDGENFLVLWETNKLTSQSLLTNKIELIQLFIARIHNQIVNVLMFIYLVMYVGFDSE